VRQRALRRGSLLLGRVDVTPRPSIKPLGCIAGEPLLPTRKNHDDRGLVMDAREERLAKNEIVFRDVNERIEDMAVAQALLLRDQRDLGFLCECSNVDCTLRLRLTLTDYEQARSDPAQFVVALGHELPEIEEVAFIGDGYQVVRKEGAAAMIAEESDPRS
jgi:hypothetical protein